MAAPVTIALDAMGGDHGPSVVLAGAAISLVRHPDTRFLLVGDEGAHRRRAQGPPGSRRQVRDPPHRRCGRHGREAEPGAAQGPPAFEHVARPRGGARRPCRRRRVRRQYRRADGHGQVLPEDHRRHRPPGDRRPLADGRGRMHRARRRRQCRRRRPPARRVCADGRRHGPRAVRHGAGRRSGSSISGWRRSRASTRSRPPTPR